MQRPAPFSALALLCLTLTGCGAATDGKAPAAAAQNATRLMAAAVAGDRVAFEAEIDRRAVRDDLRRQMVELGQARGLDVDGGPSDFTLDRMIGPDALKLVQAGTNQALTHPPTAEQLAPLLAQTGRARVCLRTHESGVSCLLTFGKVDGRWRLVGMQAMDLRIALAAS